MSLVSASRMASRNQAFEFSPLSPSQMAAPSSRAAYDPGDRGVVVLVPIFVEAEDQFVVPIGRDPGVIIAPAIALDDDQMVAVMLADRGGDPLVERGDRPVVLVLAAVAAAGTVEIPIGLVQNVVAADPRIVGVAPRDLAPQRYRPALVLGAVPQRRLCRVAVGNGEVAALAAGRGVEVEDHPHAVCRRPFEQPVDAAEAVLVPAIGSRWRRRIEKQRVMHRQANRVETPTAERVHVRLGHMMVEPRAFELIDRVLAHEFGEPAVDHMLLPEIAELQHIAFLEHPPAEAHAAQDHRLAVAVDDLRALGAEEAGAGAAVLAPPSPEPPNRAAAASSCLLDENVTAPFCEGSPLRRKPPTVDAAPPHR